MWRLWDQGYDEDGVHWGGDVSEDIGSGSSWDNIGVLLRGTKREEVERGRWWLLLGVLRRTRSLRRRRMY